MIRRLLAQQDSGFWMPQQASSYAGDVDWLFYFILVICTTMFALICVLMVLFVWRYRARPGHTETHTASHSTALELTWTIIPTIVVMFIFYYGFRGFLDMATPPPNAYEINVTARKWSWDFLYPNGHVDSELHVPNDRPVRLVLSSQDVIHSLFIPAFRIKKDAVPGRYNQTWFRPTRIGEYDLFCAEYCGTQHSGMITKVIVEDPAVFAGWLEKAGNFIDTMPPADAGRRIYEKRGCTQCHSIDGTAATGPSLKNLFGEKVLLTGGGEVTADENYLRRSIKDPGGEVVRGYENVMPLINLNDAEINVLIAFIKSISEHHLQSTQVDLGTNGAAADDADTSGVEAGSQTQGADSHDAAQRTNQSTGLGS